MTKKTAKERMAHATSQKIGIAGYVRVLAAMPGTAQEISERCKLNTSGVRLLLREFRSLSLIYASGVQPGMLRGPARPIWHFGLDWRGNDTRPTLATPRAQPIAFATVLRAMKSPASVAEIHAETGVSHMAIRKIIKAMRAASLAYVGEWEQRHGCPIAQHVLGMRADARRPKVKTREEINATQNPRRAVKHWMLQVSHALAGTSDRLSGGGEITRAWREQRLAEIA